MPALDHLLIRWATLDDAEALCQVIHAAFEPYRGLLDPPSGAHAETPDSIAGKIARGGGVMALDAGRTVGGAVCYEDEGAWYLGRLAVLPTYRQAGIGRAIVAQVEQMGRVKGYDRVTLGARVALPNNRVFFESLGYSLDSVTAHEGYDAPTVFWMSKGL